MAKWNPDLNPDLRAFKSSPCISSLALRQGQYLEFIFVFPTPHLLVPALQNLVVWWVEKAKPVLTIFFLQQVLEMAVGAEEINALRGQRPFPPL